MMKRYVTLLIILLLLSGCAKSSEKYNSSQGSYTNSISNDHRMFYGSEEMKNLVKNNTERFNELASALLDNEYEISIHSDDGLVYDYIYDFPDGTYKVISSNKSECIDKKTIEIIDSFLNDFGCHSVYCINNGRNPNINDKSWYVDITFWCGIPNSGLAFFPDEINLEYGRDLFEQLSGNWYFYCIPGV